MACAKMARRVLLKPAHWLCQRGLRARPRLGAAKHALHCHWAVFWEALPSVRDGWQRGGAAESLAKRVGGAGALELKVRASRHNGRTCAATRSVAMTRAMALSS